MFPAIAAGEGDAIMLAGTKFPADTAGKEHGALCHSAGGSTQGCCALAGPRASPILTVSPGNESLAASITGARKERELPYAAPVLDTSLIRTWCLWTVLCPLDAQTLSLPIPPTPTPVVSGVGFSPAQSALVALNQNG